MSFKQNTLTLIKQVPFGKVVSYGQVAAAAGSSLAARQVGGILKAVDLQTNLPWWRVVNNQGLISIKGNWSVTKQTQKEFLEREGVEISGDYKFDIEKYRYQFKESQ